MRSHRGSTSHKLIFTYRGTGKKCQGKERVYTLCAGKCSKIFLGGLFVVPIDDLASDVRSAGTDVQKKVRATIAEGHKVIADPMEKKFASAPCSRHEVCV